MLRDILPRIALALVLATGAVFAWFESVYLADQSRQIGDGSIAIWMWVFRLITAALVLSSAFFAGSVVRSLLGR